MENLFTITNITLFIALWGAILSTIKVLSDYSKNIRKLKVQIAYGFQREIDGSTMCISISAMNVGYRDVTLNSVGYILPDKKYLMSNPQSDVKSNVKFPCTLSEGKECSVWETQRQLAIDLKTNGYSGKIKLRGYYGSAIGTVFKSKPVKFNIGATLAKTQ
jgi:hypothetical protein